MTKKLGEERDVINKRFKLRKKIIDYINWTIIMRIIILSLLCHKYINLYSKAIKFNNNEDSLNMKVIIN